jgi:hypothetical protein
MQRFVKYVRDRKGREVRVELKVEGRKALREEQARCDKVAREYAQKRAAAERRWAEIDRQIAAEIALYGE